MLGTAKRNYFIRLFLYSLAIVLSGGVLAGYGILTFFPRSLGTDYGSIISTMGRLQEVIVMKVIQVHAVVTVLTILVVVILNVFYSHRVAGPAFRIGRESERIAAGDLTGRVQLRQNDTLKDLAEGLNEVAGSYSAKLNAIRRHVAAVEAQAVTVSRYKETGQTGIAVEQAVAEIEVNLRAIDSALSEIRA